jgi:acyl carrier protein
MKRKIKFLNIEGWINKIKDSKGLIIFVPGIFTDIKSSVFCDILNIKTDFDVFTYDVYIKANKRNLNIGIKDFVSDFSKILNNFKGSYKNIYIISYSFGSEVVLRKNLPKYVKKIAFWSPSFFYPQNFSGELKEYPKNKDILINKDITISKKLAKELDSLDTIKLISSITKPICVYSSIEERGEKTWSNKKIFDFISSEKKHINIPYKHNYTKKQVRDLYLSTTSEFLKKMKKEIKKIKTTP